MNCNFFFTPNRVKTICGILISGLALGNSWATDNSLIKNGSFEDEQPTAAPCWNGVGSFWKGAGQCEFSDQAATSGRKSLKFTATKPGSQGQSSSGYFYLIPDQKYRVSYRMKREGAQIAGRLSLEFTNGQRSGAFVCHSNVKSLRTWQKVSGKQMNILFFLPPGSKKMYLVLKDGIFSVPSKLYGKAPVKCLGKLYANGLGEVYFDDVVIEKLGAKPGKAAKKIGFGDNNREEAEILLMGDQNKSNFNQALQKKTTEKYKLELPPAFTVAPIKKDTAFRVPEIITNTKICNARVERYGKPVFVLGAELISPYLCKMYGMDFWVNSAFGNKVNANLQGDTVKTHLTTLPFLEEQVREHLQSGILVWIDMLQDYKAWHSKLLRDNFPSLFVTREGFFCWRPEEPRAQYLRHATWYNAVKKTGKYPVFVYEMFNELNYEDHSPYNYQLFRQKMAKKYGTIQKANALWGTSFDSFADVTPQGNDPLMDAVNPTSPQFKAEWSLFTEERFADIAQDSINWMRRLVPDAKISLQSYNGLPFDFQNNYVNPYLVNPKMDLTIPEYDQYIYPQWEGAENEQEILSAMRRDMDVSLAKLSAPHNALLDGECRFGAMTKMAAESNILVNLDGAWQFRASGIAPRELLKTSGNKPVPNGNDLGKQENWQRVDLDTAQWKTIKVPGMWGQQGFQNCYIGWYRKTFRGPKNGGKLFLSGEKLADRAEIYLNGKLIYQTLKWAEQFSIDVSELVKPNQDNVLAIRIYNNYFLDGYFYGGIRGNIHLTNVALKSMPITPDQFACGLGLRAFQGYSGLCLSYFYINWMEDWGCSVFNPEKFQPETVAALPIIKNRINDLAPLIYRKKHQYQDVAVTFSLNSARSYVPRNAAVSREMSFDVARYYSGAVFTHRGTDVVSDDVLDDYNKLKQFKALIICRAAAVSSPAVKNIRRFVKNGGIVWVDRLSLVRNAENGAKLDVSKLLGVERGSAVKTGAKNVQIAGLKRTYSTVKSTMVDGGYYAPLTVKNARVFARIGSTPVGAVRQLGQGKIYTFTPELVGSDYQELWRHIFDQEKIVPQLAVSGGKFVEVHTRQQDGKYLWAIFNRGKAVELNVAGQVAPGNYLVREAYDNRTLTSPSGKPYWTAAQLQQGVKIKAQNLRPIYLLLEPANAPKLALTTIPAAQTEALDKFFRPLWQDFKQPKKRVLWYGYTHYAPTVLPSAIKVMRDMGIAVDFMADRAFNPELKVIRGGQKVVAQLNSYDLIVIPRSRANITDRDAAGLKAYLAQGGNMLLLAGHVYNFHTFYNHRMTGVTKIFKHRVMEDGIKDVAHQRELEPRRFNTTKIAAHPITQNVKTFAVMGTTGVSIPGGQILIEAENTAQAYGNLPTILTVKDTGKNRIAVSGDADWLSPDGLVLADNAQLWSNLVAWLCRVPALTPQQVKKSVALPQF